MLNRAWIIQRNFANEENKGGVKKLRIKSISSLRIIVLLDQVFGKRPSLDPLSKNCGWMEKIEVWERQRLPRIMARECLRFTAVSADSYLRIHKNVIVTDDLNQNFSKLNQEDEGR